MLHDARVRIHGGEPREVLRPSRPEAQARNSQGDHQYRNRSLNALSLYRSAGCRSTPHFGHFT